MPLNLQEAFLPLIAVALGAFSPEKLALLWAAAALIAAGVLRPSLLTSSALLGPQRKAAVEPDSHQQSILLLLWGLLMEMKPRPAAEPVQAWEEASRFPWAAKMGSLTSPGLPPAFW